MLASLVLNLGEVLILAAVALLFSSFSTPFLTGAFTFGVWLVGRAAHDMVAMKGRVLSPTVKTLLSWLAEILPNFNLFVPGRATLVTKATAFGEPLAYVATSMGYSILYAAATSSWSQPPRIGSRRSLNNSSTSSCVSRLAASVISRGV